ncbi:MAG: hypothetical protein KAH10_05975 [Flavobacteriales bacterium]|nr:hypothetical protein [Flavobacteriales bacterium]
MRKLIFIGILTFFGLQSYSQSRYFVAGEFIVSPSSNELHLNDSDFNSSNTIGYGVGIYYQYYIDNKYFVKTGLEFINDFSNTTVDDFEVNTVRYLVNLPIIIGLRFYEKWEVGTGFSFSPLIEIHQIEKHTDNFITTNINFELAYWLSEKFRLEFSYSRTLSEPYNNDYIINHYQPIKLTISYNIF